MKKLTLFTLLAIGITGVAFGDQEKKENGHNEDKVAGIKKDKDNHNDSDKSQNKHGRQREPEPLPLYETDEKRTGSPAPEIDPGVAASAAALLSGVLLITRGRRTN